MGFLIRQRVAYTILYIYIYFFLYNLNQFFFLDAFHYYYCWKPFFCLQQIYLNLVSGGSRGSKGVEPHPYQGTLQKKVVHPLDLS